MFPLLAGRCAWLRFAGLLSLLLPVFAPSAIVPLHAAPPLDKTHQFISPKQTPEGLQKSDWQSIRAAHTAWQHGFTPVEGGWQALNPGQQWTTRFDTRGFLTAPKNGAWTWGLQLQSYGVGEKQTPISGRPTIKAKGQHLSYQWDATLEEWWVNDQRGLEHGYTLARRPSAPPNSQSSEAAVPGKSGAPRFSGEQTLNFVVAIRGTLTPTVADDALGVFFVDATGATVLNYTGLKVTDADGRALASHFEPLGEKGVRLVVEDRAARYPITIDPVAQQAYGKPSEPLGSSGAGDYFGISVAVSGDTVVVGASLEDSSTTGINSTPNESAFGAGAAYVFVRSGTTWSQQAYLKPAVVGTTQAMDQFGSSVAVSGDTVVVGAHGEGSSTTGINSTPNEGQGASGAVYVFVRSGTTWSQQAYLKPAAVGSWQVGDNFGVSVAVSGDTVVVGAPNEDSGSTGINSTPNDNVTGAGAAYVFVRSGTIWSQQAYLKPAVVGTDQWGDNFGRSVTVSGDTVVVGAPSEDSSSTGINSTPNESAPFAGAAYVFVRSGTMWSQQAYLKPAVVGTTQANDGFGRSTAVSGDTVVIGAPYEYSSTTGINSMPNESANQAGAAYVFVRSGTTWSQQAYLKPGTVGTTQAYDEFGTSVAVSGDSVVVGAQFEASSSTGPNSTPNEGALFAGAAYFFVRHGTTWSQQAYLKPATVGSTQADDYFGRSVAVSGDTVVVGAYHEDSSTTGINSLPNEDATDSGAFYVFTGLSSDLSPPSGGTMLLTPVSPLDANAAVTVAFAGWTDDSTPLSYTVLVDNVVVSPAGASASRSFTGPATPGGYTLKGRIADALGNQTEVTQPFIVLTAQESWRRAHFVITTNTGLAADTADPDGDGNDNLFEFVAGLEPTDAASRFLLRVEVVAGQPGQKAIIFSPRLSGRTYAVQYKASLTDPTWTPLIDLTTSDNGSERSITDLSAGPGPRFYRVLITLP